MPITQIIPLSTAVRKHIAELELPILQKALLSDRSSVGAVDLLEEFNCLRVQYMEGKPSIT